jgi:type II secretory ATPase GspE/PulE/Tfp pilus assembly ATPase PilB-like protein
MQLEEAAISRGMIPLRDDAARLVRENAAAPEEVARVLG